MDTQTRDVRVIPCEVYSRVCGYFRPVSGWNPGKVAEFSDRRFLLFPKAKKDPFPPGVKVEK